MLTLGLSGQASGITEGAKTARQKSGDIGRACQQELPAACHATPNKWRRHIEGKKPHRSLLS